MTTSGGSPVSQNVNPSWAPSKLIIPLILGIKLRHHRRLQLQSLKGRGRHASREKTNNIAIRRAKPALVFAIRARVRFRTMDCAQPCIVSPTWMWRNDDTLRQKLCHFFTVAVSVFSLDRRYAIFVRSPRSGLSTQSVAGAGRAARAMSLRSVSWAEYRRLSHHNLESRSPLE